jgi:hypothetical protein
LECKVWIFEDVIHEDYEFAHDGGERNFGRFACGAEPLVKLFELAIGMSAAGFHPLNSVIWYSSFRLMFGMRSGKTQRATSSPCMKFNWYGKLEKA